MIDADKYNLVYWHHSRWMSLAGPQMGRQSNIQEAVRATDDADLHEALSGVLEACQEWYHAQTPEAWYHVMDKDAEFIILLAQRVASTPSGP